MSIWASREFADAELGDERRVKRLVRVASLMESMPDGSLPKIAGSAGELEAMYRLLNNEAVEWDDILDEHIGRSAARAMAQPEALVVHDTTSFQFAHADPEEVGYLQTGKPGFYGHFSLFLAADDTRRPLGVAQLQTQVRASRAPKGGRKVNRPGSTSAKDPNNESKRWLAGVVATREQVEPSTKLVHLMDREGDSYALLARMQQMQERFVVRLRHNRVARAAGLQGQAWDKLQPLMESAHGQLEREVPLSPRRAKTAPRHAKRNPARKSRLAKLQVAALATTVRAPSYCPADLPDAIELNIVRVYEPHPPQDQQPVEWWLATTEPVDNAEQVARVVDLYRHRWVIEEFFKALKTGCLYERRELESLHALLNTLAICAPIACRLLWLRSRAQHQPQAPASDVLDDDELLALRHLHKGPIPNAPTAQQVLGAMAAVGGHLKRNGPPGWQTLQRGFDQVQSFAAGYRAARAEKM